MERELTPSESLKLIETMIGQAKRRFSRFSYYFILWGVLMIAAMVVTYLMRNDAGPWGHGAAWGVAGAIGGAISMVQGIRQGKAAPAENPLDRLVGWTWITYVITMFLMIVVLAGAGRDPGVAIALLTGLPTFLTGRILGFRPLMVGGILFWASGLAMHFAQDALAITAIYCVAMLFGYIVPGYLLKRQEDGLRTA